VNSCDRLWGKYCDLGGLSEGSVAAAPENSRRCGISGVAEADPPFHGAAAAAATDEAGMWLAATPEATAEDLGDLAPAVFEDDRMPLPGGDPGPSDVATADSLGEALRALLSPLGLSKMDLRAADKPRPSHLCRRVGGLHCQEVCYIRICEPPQRPVEPVRIGGGYHMVQWKPCGSGTDRVEWGCPGIHDTPSELRKLSHLEDDCYSKGMVMPERFHLEEDPSSPTRYLFRRLGASADAAPDSRATSPTSPTSGHCAPAVGQGCTAARILATKRTLHQEASPWDGPTPETRAEPAAEVEGMKEPASAVAERALGDILSALGFEEGPHVEPLIYRSTCRMQDKWHVEFCYVYADCLDADEKAKSRSRPRLCEMATQTETPCAEAASQTETPCAEAASQTEAPPAMTECAMQACPGMAEAAAQASPEMSETAMVTEVAQTAEVGAQAQAQVVEIASQAAPSTVERDAQVSADIVEGAVQTEAVDAASEATQTSLSLRPDFGFSSIGSGDESPMSTGVRIGGGYHILDVRRVPPAQMPRSASDGQLDTSTAAAAMAEEKRPGDSGNSSDALPTPYALCLCPSKLDGYAQGAVPTERRGKYRLAVSEDRQAKEMYNWTREYSDRRLRSSFKRCNEWMPGMATFRVLKPRAP